MNDDRNARLDELERQLTEQRTLLQGPTTRADRFRIEKNLRGIVLALRAIPPRYRAGILPEHREIILRGLPSRHPQNTAPAPTATARSGEINPAV